MNIQTWFAVKEDFKIPTNEKGNHYTLVMLEQKKKYQTNAKAIVTL